MARASSSGRALQNAFPDREIKREKQLQLAEKSAKQTSDFLNRLVKEVMDLGRSKLTSASLLGVFVIYVQSLEQEIKSFLRIVYLHRSHSIGERLSLVKNREFNDLSLGALINELRSLRLEDKKTNQDYILQFLAKLERFNSGKRNVYIHKVLSGQVKLDKTHFDKDLTLAHIELSQLIKDIREITEKTEKLFGLDGSFPKFVESVADMLDKKNVHKDAV